MIEIQNISPLLTADGKKLVETLREIFTKAAWGDITKTIFWQADYASIEEKLSL